MSVSFTSHVALFGGSFNPPHLGHLKAVEGLFKEPKVAKVIILPSFGTPLKNTETAFEHRYQMAKLNFSNEIEVSRFEEKEKTTYTWEVLEKLSAQYSKLAFVIGTDQLEKLDQWARFPSLLSLCDWIVLIRKPKTLSDFREILQKLVTHQAIVPTRHEREFKINRNGTSRSLYLCDTDAEEISSTQIREQLALGKKDWVAQKINPKVLTYIERNHLYGT